MSPEILALLPLLQPLLAKGFVSLQSWVDSKVTQADEKIVADALVAFVQAVVNAELAKLVASAAPAAPAA